MTKLCIDYVGLLLWPTLYSFLPGRPCRLFTFYLLIVLCFTKLYDYDDDDI